MLDIHNFAMTHNLRLNPTKCKEMHLIFLHNANCPINPIIIGGNVIECDNTDKILGFITDKDLKWNSHVEYTLLRKPVKSYNYLLRVLRTAGCAKPTS